MKSHIALDATQSEALAKKLNHLLADYHIFYMNVRGYHWNIKGEKFFELHVKFEELYTDLTVKIDEIAERILTLGFTPLHAYSDFIRTSDIPEKKDISDGMQAVNEIRVVQSAFRTSARDPQTFRRLGRRRHEFSNERLHHRSRKACLDVSVVRGFRLGVPTY